MFHKSSTHPPHTHTHTNASYSNAYRQPIIRPEEFSKKDKDAREGYVIQPGSTVATALSEGERLRVQCFAGLDARVPGQRAQAARILLTTSQGQPHHNAHGAQNHRRVQEEARRAGGGERRRNAHIPPPSPLTHIMHTSRAVTGESKKKHAVLVEVKDGEWRSSKLALNTVR